MEPPRHGRHPRRDSQAPAHQANHGQPPNEIPLPRTPPPTQLLRPPGALSAPRALTIEHAMGSPSSPRICFCGIGVPGERFLIAGVILGGIMGAPGPAFGTWEFRRE